VLKVMRLRAEREKGAVPGDLRARFEALEGEVRTLRQDLDETHERLDFTERLLSKAREEKRLT
jgi:predicted  nucleic acid-binding Zn-ribbon protein